MGTLVDSQRPWLWTQADLLWHSCLFPWLSALEPFTEGSGPAGFCSTPLAHGTLTDSCFSNGQAVVYQVLSPGLSVLCVSTQPPVFCKPASWPWIPPKGCHAAPGVLPSPKIARDSVILHLCEDIVRCKCLPQLLPGTSNLCKYFSWLHSPLQDTWVMKGQSWAGEGIWNKISF